METEIPNMISVVARVPTLPMILLFTAATELLCRGCHGKSGRQNWSGRTTFGRQNWSARTILVRQNWSARTILVRQKWSCLAKNGSLFDH